MFIMVTSILAYKPQAALLLPPTITFAILALIRHIIGTLNKALKRTDTVLLQTLSPQRSLLLQIRVTLTPLTHMAIPLLPVGPLFPHQRVILGTLRPVAGLLFQPCTI